MDIRQATIDDLETVLYFIHQIAIYEKMEDQVIATKESLHEWMFEKGICQAIIASVDGKDVGFALYFFNFSTFVGKAGLYLEDLYVSEAVRGQGVGRALIEQVYDFANKKNCNRVYWTTQEGNTTARKLYDVIAIQTDMVQYHQEL